MTIRANAAAIRALALLLMTSFLHRKNPAAGIGEPVFHATAVVRTRAEEVRGKGARIRKGAIGAERSETLPADP
jgi:hypothetical protein